MHVWPMRRSCSNIALGGAECLLVAGLLCSAPALAELPPDAASMLREARGSERDTIENVLKRLYPQERRAIDDLIDKIEDEEKAAVAETRFVRGWTGDIAVGASMSSGNNQEWSVTGSVDIERKGPRWEHRLQGDIDIKDVEGERTDESLSASYRVRRDFGKSNWFVFGGVSYERDRPKGIGARFTEVIGPGYQLIDSDELDWEISAGPALRQTSLTTGEDENQVALFLSTDLEWDITDTLKFRQQAWTAIDGDNTSAEATTSLTMDIYGRLSSRLSFELDYESDPPESKQQIDTATRFTLAIGF